MSKVCKNCRERFDPEPAGAVVCSESCAMAYAVSTGGKARKLAAVKTAALERRADAAKLAKLKTRSQWAKEAQASFNAWVRARDAGNACISCGRHHAGQNHAGHYLSVGARPELRYEPLNVHLQCAPCNTHLSGNAVLYRKALVVRVGVETVEWLEGPHEPKKYTIADFIGIKATYAIKTRNLKKLELTA